MVVIKPKAQQVFAGLSSLAPFISRPDLHPLNLTVDYQAENASAKLFNGHIFISPSTGKHQSVQIFDSSLQPVFIGPDRTDSNHTYDFFAQEHEGKTVLSLWTGEGSPYSGGTGEHAQDLRCPGRWKKYLIS